MKHLIFTALFLLSYTVAVRAQIVFPTPNQVEMQTGNLILGEKGFYVRRRHYRFLSKPFSRRSTLPHSHQMAKKRIQSRYLLDNRLIPAPRRLPDQDSSATDGNQRLRQRRIHLCRTNATPMGSRFSRIYHLCLAQA